MTMGKPGRPRKGETALGVYYKNGRWQARYKGGSGFYLGTRDTLLDAAALVKSEQAKRLKMRG